MRGTWSAAKGRLVLTGSFDDVSVHRHAVVQIAVGLNGPVEVTTGGGRVVQARVVVVAAGARHALKAGPQVTALSVYLRPGCRAGVALNETCRADRDDCGVWVPPDDASLADDIAAVLASGDLGAAADHLQDALLLVADGGVDGIHPQLGEAIDVVDRQVPAAVDLQTVARAVALSPDYLGRLFKRQTGVSFSETARWMRLLTGLHHLSRGVSVTDAAHLAGFADGAHANRVCREFAGVAPSEVARAFEDHRPAG